jgi:hypothetical protein
MNDLNINIEKAQTWLTGGAVNGKPSPGLTYHCRITTKDWEEEEDERYITVAYDFPDEVISESNAKEIVEMGNEKLISQLKEKLIEANKEFI